MQFKAFLSSKKEKYKGEYKDNHYDLTHSRFSKESGVLYSRKKEKSDAPGITLLAKPRIGRSDRTLSSRTAKSIFMIPLYHNFVNVQLHRRRCTVFSVGTVQFVPTKVFILERPRCSAPPPYSDAGRHCPKRITAVSQINNYTNQIYRK